MAGTGALTASVVVIGFDLQDVAAPVTVAFLVVALVTAAGNMLNDYYDRETDKVNHPERPIPSGSMRAKDALYISLLMFATSILLSFFINPLASMVTMIAVGLLISYESALKRRGAVGNITISALVAMVFLMGGAAAGSVVFEDRLVLILGLLAFFSTLGREIIKDVEDIAGDSDRTTLPKVVGMKGALVAGNISLVIAVGLSPLPFFPLGIFGRPYVLTVVGADILFCWAAFASWSDPHQAQSSIKYGMLVALFAFLNGALFS